MKAASKLLFLLGAIIVVLELIAAGPVAAQTFTVLHNFAGGANGGYPLAGLTLSGNTLYGATQSSNTLFKMDTDGSNFMILFSFTNASQGSIPDGTLLLSGDTLYGTTFAGGSWGYGTLFAINTDGSGFTNLYNFTDGKDGTDDGSGPYPGLILSSNVLYGTTWEGGTVDRGTAFAFDTIGKTLTTLHSFTNGTDGSYPFGGVILSSNTLYGTAEGGGTWYYGTIYAIDIGAKVLTTLHTFDLTNGDGPHGGLILSSNVLYGTAFGGTASGVGSVFACNLGTGVFTNLHEFAMLGPFPSETNSDGANPRDTLLLSGGMLYGTTELGGIYGDGTVFALSTNGSSFTNLHYFAALPLVSYTNTGGGDLYAGLVISEDTLYGTAYQGGPSGVGTVYSISIAPQISATPQLSIIASGSNIVFSWPASAAGVDYSGYTLQSVTNLVSAVWSAVTLAPSLENGVYTATNPVSGTQQFFRLTAH